MRRRRGHPPPPLPLLRCSALFASPDCRIPNIAFLQGETVDMLTAEDNLCVTSSGCVAVVLLLFWTVRLNVDYSGAKLCCTFHF